MGVEQLPGRNYKEGGERKSELVGEGKGGEGEGWKGG